MTQPLIERPAELSRLLAYKKPDMYYGPLMETLESTYERYKADPTFAFAETQRMAPPIAETMKLIGGICCHLQHTGSTEKAAGRADAFRTAAYAPSREAVVFCQTAIADIRRAVTDVSASVQLIEGVISRVDERIDGLLRSKSAITSFLTLGSTWSQEELLEAHDVGLIVTTVTYYLYGFFETVLLPFRLWAVYEYVRQDMLCHDFLRDRSPATIAKAIADSGRCTAEKAARIVTKNDLFNVKDREALYKRVGPAIRAAGELYYKGMFHLMDLFKKYTRTGDSRVLDGWSTDHVQAFGRGTVDRQTFKDERLGKFAQVMNPFGIEYLKGWVGRSTGAVGTKGFFDTVSSIEGVIASFTAYRAAVQGVIQSRTSSIKSVIAAVDKGLIVAVENMLKQAPPPLSTTVRGGGRRRLNRWRRKTYKNHAAARRRRTQNLQSMESQ